MIEQLCAHDNAADGHEAVIKMRTRPAAEVATVAGATQSHKSVLRPGAVANVRMMSASGPEMI